MPTKTATGNPIIIYDAAGGVVNSASVSLGYVQEGTGTPSLSNVRTINGNDLITVKVANQTDENNYAVTLSAVTGGVVYGGSLNLLTGELIVTHWSFKPASVAANYWTDQNTLWRFKLTDPPLNAPGVSQTIREESISNNLAWGNNTPETFDITLANNFRIFRGNFSNLNEMLLAIADTVIVYPLETPLTFTVSQSALSLFSGYNNISSTGNSVILEVNYNEKSFTVTLPELFTYSPTNPYAGDTVTLTYSGDIEPETLVAVGVDTMTNVPLTKTGDKTWTFTMPTEDVGVTVGYKSYAEIELIQATGGIVSANKTIAYDGDTVTLTMTPSENYEPQSVKVTKDARDVETTKVSDTTYTFVVHIQ